MYVFIVVTEAQGGYPYQFCPLDSAENMRVFFEKMMWSLYSMPPVAYFLQSLFGKDTICHMIITLGK